MFKTEDMKDEIVQAISYIVMCLDVKNKSGYFDINKECENFFCQFFNCLFDVNLINLNIYGYTYPAIDLGDLNSSLCIQVTSETNFEKIKNTVEIFSRNELNKVYSNLKIFIIGEKDRYRKKEITTDNGNMIISDIVFDCRDLGRLIYNENNTDKIKNLYNIVISECNSYVNNNKNYLNGIQAPNVTLGNSYYSFVKSFGYKDNDPDLPLICDNIARSIYRFAYALSELNFSTRQILYAIILRRIIEIQRSFLSTVRTEANSIFLFLRM